MSLDDPNPARGGALSAACPFDAADAVDVDLPISTSTPASRDPHTPPASTSEADELLRAAFARTPTEAFHDYIRSDSFPCVGAKAALVQSQITVLEAGDIRMPTHDVEIYRAIKAFRDTLHRDKPIVQSFAVIYPDSGPMDEKLFERAMWERLQCLHNFDAIAGEEWAPDVQPDPDNPHFSMSVGGEAFFVVGLHPGAHRPARCFRHPVMVFNSHDQFERMRADGRFDRMKTIIRKRDAALSGSTNPVLDDFGNTSEARQYAGRKTEEGWTAPLVIKSDGPPETEMIEPQPGPAKPAVPVADD